MTGTFNWTGGTLQTPLTVPSGGVVSISGPDIKAYEGSITGMPVVPNLAGSTTLSGPLGVLWGGATPPVINNTGTFTAQPGASISAPSSIMAAFNNPGMLINDSGSSTTTIGIKLANSGTIQLLSGFLKLSVPSFTEPDGATLLVTIRGITPGTDFGQLQVTNNTTWGGNLLLTNANGFIPTPGQTFRALTCGGACTGQFASVSVNYRAKYDPQNVTLIPLTAIALDPPDPTIAQATTQQSRHDLPASTDRRYGANMTGENLRRPHDSSTAISGRALNSIIIGAGKPA